MKKASIIMIFLVLICYSILSLFVEIPKVINNIFYGLTTVLAIYFMIFHLDISNGIKTRFQENKENMEKK
jgi:hypothetical protein